MIEDKATRKMIKESPTLYRFTGTSSEGKIAFTNNLVEVFETEIDTYGIFSEKLREWKNYLNQFFLECQTHSWLYYFCHGNAFGFY